MQWICNDHGYLSGYILIYKHKSWLTHQWHGQPRCSPSCCWTVSPPPQPCPSYPPHSGPLRSCSGCCHQEKELFPDNFLFTNRKKNLGWQRKITPDALTVKPITLVIHVLHCNYCIIKVIQKKRKKKTRLHYLNILFHIFKNYKYSQFIYFWLHCTCQVLSWKKSFNFS